MSGLKTGRSFRRAPDRAARGPTARPVRAVILKLILSQLVSDRTPYVELRVASARTSDVAGVVARGVRRDRDNCLKTVKRVVDGPSVLRPASSGIEDGTTTPADANRKPPRQSPPQSAEARWRDPARAATSPGGAGASRGGIGRGSAGRPGRAMWACRWQTNGIHVAFIAIKLYTHRSITVAARSGHGSGPPPNPECLQLHYPRPIGSRVYGLAHSTLYPIQPDARSTLAATSRGRLCCGT